MGGEKISMAASDGGSFGGYLSRPGAGRGPVVIVLQEIFGVNAHIRAVCDRYAEEGYLAFAPDIFWRVERGIELDYDDSGIQRGRELAGRCDLNLVVKDIAAAIQKLRTLEGASGQVAAVGFCFGGLLAYLTAARTDADVAICYYGGGIDRFASEARDIRCPIMLHWGAQDAGIPAPARETVRTALAGHDRAECYVYADAGHGFHCDRRPGFHRFSARLAHSRTLGLLHWTIGPRYDLSELWERHVAEEFATHDVDATMRTMVPEPYVNHIPTLTGGVGYQELRYFYANHFIPRLPPDTKVVPLTRTIGPDRLIDEFVLCFTHDREVDFMAPGIPATGRYVEVPHVAVVEFRGDKIAHEHIHWDHASLLRQLGVLDSTRLPIAGIQGAKKLVDETLPANQLMPSWRRRAG
ncbi:MAG TPA: dienelactone hydrolase family protein [Candidatus Binataceae bacterium]|nr:dienelactone hydrolase family protein [Candidatus Binataceae bacterium]